MKKNYISQEYYENTILPLINEKTDTNKTDNSGVKDYKILQTNTSDNRLEIVQIGEEVYYELKYFYDLISKFTFYNSSNDESTNIKHLYYSLDTEQFATYNPYKVTSKYVLTKNVAYRGGPEYQREVLIDDFQIIEYSSKDIGNWTLISKEYYKNIVMPLIK